MATVDRLAEELAGPPGVDPIGVELKHWLAGSRRFRAFAEANRDKIRKKLRSASDADSRRDVRAELRLAHLLLGDRRVELAYEAYGSTKGGPDFTVSFRGDRVNLEVTRLRGAPRSVPSGGPLLAKLRQLPPSVPNIVVVAVDGESAEAFDVAAATRALRARADAKDGPFFAIRGLAGTRAFHERYGRLGAVLTWCEDAEGDARVASWVNPSARIAVPDRALRACLAALRAG